MDASKMDLGQNYNPSWLSKNCHKHTHASRLPARARSGSGVCGPCVVDLGSWDLGLRLEACWNRLGFGWAGLVVHQPNLFGPSLFGGYRYTYMCI